MKIAHRLPKPLIALAALVLVVLVGAASGAAATWLDLAHAGLTASYTLYKNIRTIDGRLNAYDLTTDPQGGEIYEDDGTGTTFTTPTASTITSATLTLCNTGATRGGMTCTANGAKLTATKSGLYRVKACINDGSGANTATITLNLYEKIGSGSDTDLALGTGAVTKTLTAQPWIPICAEGLVKVAAADAASTAIFTGKITASTGDVVVKKYKLSAWKVDELSPATP